MVCCWRISPSAASCTKPRCVPMKIPTDCPSYMPCELSAARWQPTVLFPPRGRREFHKAVLNEILDERVASSRNRRNLRGVKRKMTRFPVRRGYTRSPLLDIRAVLRILK